MIYELVQISPTIYNVLLKEGDKDMGMLCYYNNNEEWLYFDHNITPPTKTNILTIIDRGLELVRAHNRINHNLPSYNID